MGNSVSVYEAKTHLSRLIDRAAAGDEVVITRHGRPVAKIGPIEPRRERRRLGILKGKVRVRADFDEPLPDEILDAFEGRVRP